jgi:hypothetical protein
MLLGLATPASTQEQLLASYAQIENEIGCDSKATDAKKDMIFNH